jgi:hypothetical protein
MPATPVQNDPFPIACTLTDPDLAARSAELKAGLFAGVEESRDLPDGIAYLFAGTDQQMHALFAFVEAERSCCSFFRFELDFEPGNGPIWLRLTGPEEAKGFIRETFGGKA